jgi:hypothetical protein
MASHLVEIAVDLIETQIKSNIAAALAAVRTQRADAFVTTELPKGYYNYQPAKGYDTPAVFIIPENIDFKKERGANHTNATAKINVAVIIEDQTADRLVARAWRYQSALYSLLDQVPLTTTDNTFKIVVIVRRAEFTEEYSDSTRKGQPSAAWRKGVLLECEVEMFEELKINGGS